jgi:O-antigen/teichoic acid export membrane protein
VFKELMARVDARLARHGNLGAILVKGVLGTAGIRAAHGVLGFLTAIVLAKMLGPSGYGTYAFVMALVGFVTIPSELGVPGLAVREVAASNARKDWGYMRGFIIRSHQMIGLMSAVLATFGATALLIWGRNLDPIKASCMWLALLLIPLVSLGSLRGAMLRGLRKVVLGQLPEQVIRPASLLLLILVLHLAGHGFETAVSVMSVQIISVAIAFACGLVLFVRNRPEELATAVPHFKSSAAWLHSSIPFGLSAAMQLINGRTDVLVLGMFRDDAEIGVYRVAVQLATLIIFAQQTVNAIQGPHVAHLYAAGDTKKLQKMITKSSRAIFMFSLSIVILLVLLGEPIIRIAFGPQYAGAYWPLVILSVGQLVNASTGAVANVLNMTGHERDTTRIILVGAVLNVALNFMLTPVLGMIGAAVATASGLITWNLLMWHRAYKRTGIDTSPLVRRRGHR